LSLFEFSEPSASEGDKVMNAIHTVGRLSNKFARRVYNILSSHAKNPTYDSLRQYINSVATVMHLTDYLNILNENLRAATSSNQTENTEEKSSSCTQNTEEKKSNLV
jgi:perilipin-2